MEDKSISFLRYVKIAQESDAFFESEQFCPFIRVQLSTHHSNLPLEANFYTAGNTNNPEDYSLPDISDTVSPKKLIRINPFNSNFTDKINTYDFDFNEEIIQEEVYEPFVNEEAKRLLSFMKNKSKQKLKISNTDLLLKTSSYSEYTFEIKSRNFEEKSDKFSYEENESITLNDGTKVNSSSKNPSINKTENNTNIYNNKEIHVDTAKQQIEYKAGDIRYDIQNQSFSTNIDFTNNFSTTNIVNEIKTEIIQEVNSSINKLENTFINQSVTRNEITKVENNIIKVIEEKLVERDSKLLEKIEEKTKKDLKSFSRDFLNS
jgi:hypothetical protein